MALQNPHVAVRTFPKLQEEMLLSNLRILMVAKSYKRVRMCSPSTLPVAAFKFLVVQAPVVEAALDGTTGWRRFPLPALGDLSVAREDVHLAGCQD